MGEEIGKRWDRVVLTIRQLNVPKNTSKVLTLCIHFFEKRMVCNESNFK